MALTNIKPCVECAKWDRCPADFMRIESRIYKLFAEGEDCFEEDDNIHAHTIDAEPVVRCEDCVCWERAIVNKKGFLICPASGMEITYEDFCSYGERRADNATD